MNQEKMKENQEEMNQEKIPNAGKVAFSTCAAGVMGWVATKLFWTLDEEGEGKLFWWVIRKQQDWMMPLSHLIRYLLAKELIESTRNLGIDEDQAVEGLAYELCNYQSEQHNQGI